MSYNSSTFLGPNTPSLLVLAEWWRPNAPLAIAYEPACRVRSNSKLKYLAMFKIILLLNLRYREQAAPWANLLLAEW